LNVESLFPSKYLKKEDLDGDTQTKILGIEAVEMENDGGMTETKHVLILEGLKPMVINRTNSNTIVELYGGETDGWSGKPITLFVDKTVQMKGRVVGGLRIRRNGQTGTTGTAPVVTQEEAEALFLAAKTNEWPREAMQRILLEVANVDSFFKVAPQFHESLKKHLGFPYKVGAETDVVVDDIPF